MPLSYIVKWILYVIQWKNFVVFLFWIYKIINSITYCVQLTTYENGGPCHFNFVDSTNFFSVLTYVAVLETNVAFLCAWIEFLGVKRAPENWVKIFQNKTNCGRISLQWWVTKIYDFLKFVEKFLCLNNPKIIFQYTKNCRTGVNSSKKNRKKYKFLTIIK